MRRIIFIAVIVLLSVLGTWLFRSIEDGNRQNDIIAMSFDPSFDLQDHNGRTVSLNDFLGKYVLIYFGFTFCPDICPTELQKMAQAFDKLTPSQQAKLQMVFITLDPERDTTVKLKKYVPLFHSNLIGLTGAMANIQKVAKNYHVFFEKTGKGQGYMINHTSLFYLIDPKGKPIGVLKSELNADQLAENIRF